MSAFVVEQTTINKILSWLRHEFQQHAWLRQIAKRYQVDVTTDGWEQRLAQEMYALNVAAVNQRYHETNPAPEMVYAQYPYVSRISAWKALVSIEPSTQTTQITMHISVLALPLLGSVVAANSAGQLLSLNARAVSGLFERQTQLCTPVPAPATCEKSCGPGYVECVSFPTCYNPGEGDVCCSDGCKLSLALRFWCVNSMAYFK